jgi:tRNA-modifying protein YgfZ
MIALEHIGLLRFTGPDAQSFLQGQISNDTRRLQNGEPLLAAFSTPQGRVIALLRLLPHSSGVIAMLPREMALPTLERLRKFVLRAKVQMEDLSAQFGAAGEGVVGEGVVGEFESRAPQSPAYVEEDGLGVCRVIGDPSRQWIIGPSASLAKRGLDAGGEVQSEQGWRLADIRAGLPQVYAATQELFVAQMLNLDLIDGISFNKGCYTGQEIIARTQHLGRIKRRMFRLRLPPGSWEIGQSLRLTDGRSGRLIELAPEAGEFEALAVLNIDAGTGESELSPSDAVAAVELPLPYVSVSPTI